MQVEQPPPSVYQLRRRYAHQCSRADITEPVAVVVDPGPANSCGDGIESDTGKRISDIVRERRCQGERHGGVTGWHRILSGEGFEVVRIQVLAGTAPADDVLCCDCSPAREQKSDRETSAGPGYLVVATQQTTGNQPQGDGPIDLRLAKMFEATRHIVLGRGAMVLSIPLG